MLSIALLGAVGMAQADSGAETIRLTTVWKMSLDANGKPVALALQPGRAREALGRILESAIRQWEFTPGAINGKPAPTETNLFVGLTLSPKDDRDGYTVRIDRVGTGAGIGRITQLPYFSVTQAAKARKGHVNPLVMLLVTMDGEGKPEEIAVAQ